MGIEAGHVPVNIAGEPAVRDVLDAAARLAESVDAMRARLSAMQSGLEDAERQLEGTLDQFRAAVTAARELVDEPS